MSGDKHKSDQSHRPVEVKKRFIAGAVCPACGRMDKLVVYGSGSAQCRECVRCGFREARPALSTDESLPSSGAEDKSQAARAVRLVDVSEGGHEREEL